MANHPSPSESNSSLRIPYPRGLLRLAFRAPILLYKLRLGWLLGNRFLMLQHRGRHSGVAKRTVIEAIGHDPDTGSVTVVSAWGERADWYRNVTKHPRVEVTVSSQRFRAIARTVTRQEAAIRLKAYAQRHPIAFKQIGSLLAGERSRDVDETIRRFAASMPVVEFVPDKSSGNQKAA